MRIYISCDMEGVAGVVHPDQADPGGEDYGLTRELLTAEVNAAIRGARAAGATEIVVNDSHYYMRNLRLDLMDPDVRIILGSTKQYSMMEGLDSSFDAAAFIGYHAKAGTERAVIDHTYHSPATCREIRLNGESVGETVINAAIAGVYGVPVVLVTGDDKLAAEARAAIPGITTAEVKQGLGRYAASTLSPARACALIEDSAAHAVRTRARVRPLVLTSPVSLQVELPQTAMADAAQDIPGVNRVGGRTLEFAASGYLEVFRALRTILRVAETVAK
ncbi:MAG: M55 family metallopeptidase [Clostridia bacterium]|nr:M55 family metallopeptidase [Clostridia bacterium]